MTCPSVKEIKKENDKLSSLQPPLSIKLYKYWKQPQTRQYVLSRDNIWLIIRHVQCKQIILDYIKLGWIFPRLCVWLISVLELGMKKSSLQINSKTIRQQHMNKSASWREASNCSTETEVGFVFCFWSEKETHQTPLGADSLWFTAAFIWRKALLKPYHEFPEPERSMGSKHTTEVEHF